MINLFFIFLGTALSHAQKNDYMWLQGYDSYGGYDAHLGLYFGNPVMNFNYSPVQITRDSLAMFFNWTNTSFSDSNGNLLFYTNGAYIANSLGDSIENGDSINWGIWMAEIDPSHGSEGYLTKDGIYALQSLTNSNQYYIIHSLIDTNDESGGAILCTLLDMSLNQGRGQVIYKNQPLIIDKVATGFTITRHANGKYWWIMVQKRNTNCYYRILLDETGPHLIPDSVCGGATYTLDEYDFPMNFSQDGSKLISVGYYAGLNIFDFDRCTGNIGNALNIPYPFLADSEWTCAGLATSPNSRYLYVSLAILLLQYDLWANDIPASVDTIARYDGFNGQLPTYFCTAQNGPDGKIYISCGNADTVYHVINNPDAKGDSCNFVQHGVYLPSPSCGIPSFPNYRLGALPANACDTTIGVNAVQAAKEQIIHIYPNPANTYAIVDYGFTDWNKCQPDLEICNILGQVVYTQTLPMYSGLQQIDISQFATGTYAVFIKRGSGVVAVNKLVVVH